MQYQDSSDPTGVHGETGAEVPGNSVSRARMRKANSALQMRLAGATWNEIATALGYPTARTALVATEKALERELRHTDDREKMRRLAGARLDRLLRSVWSKAIDTQSPDQLLAVSKAREVIADHRKLFGLDAPVEVVVHNPTQAELEAWVAKVSQVAIPKVPEYNIVTGEVIGGVDDVPA